MTHHNPVASGQEDVKAFFRLCNCLFLLCLFGCQAHRGYRHAERHGFLMDTLVKVSVYDREHTVDHLEMLIDSTLQRMGEIERLISAYVDSSDIHRVNRYAGKEWVTVSNHVALLIDAARQVADVTGGAFDITIGPIKRLWGFDRPVQSVPDGASIREYLKLGNYKQILTDNNRVFIRTEGLKIDLGGIAKGYILDCGVNMLTGTGIDAGLVEGGGDLRVFGDHPKRKHWRIGIRHPRSDRGGLSGVLSLDEESVATSGDYERFFFENGVRYHHLLDPRTGYPARGCVSATVVAENAMLADAYATAVFVMGAKEGLEFLNQNGMKGLILVETDNGVESRMSDAIQGKVQRL